MTFDDFNLNPIILRNLKQMGYVQPRPIQAMTITPIVQGHDLIGLAKTGTGKTAAFIAPIAHQLISAKPPRAKGRPIDPATRLRALVLCPTRELAQQVADEAKAIAQGSVLRVACAYGKVAITPQAQAIARGVDLLVATPGRVRELLDAGDLSLAYIRTVTIDEADRMLDMGFLPQIRQILQVTASDRQTLLFTATMPAEIEELAKEFLRDPIRLEADRHTTPVQHVQQHLLPVDDDDKVALLIHLLQSEEKSNENSGRGARASNRGKHGSARSGVLIFCRTKRRVGWVGTALRRNEITVGMLHGDMSQAQRKKSLDRFANRELHVLVATDVAARGLHIPAVKTVVNYDLPLTPEEYVHRIGRAAHGEEAAGGQGQAYTLLADDQQERLRWRAVLNRLGVEVFAETLEGFVPSKPKRSKSGGGVEARQDERPISRNELRRQMRKPRRSKKSRPIKKGQKPGRGVIHLQ